MRLPQNTLPRGVVGLEVEVVTAGTDMHSGLKGGSVSNPCLVLAALLASLHDADGRIAVEGFYDVGAVPLRAWLVVVFLGSRCPPPLRTGRNGCALHAPPPASPAERARA